MAVVNVITAPHTILTTKATPVDGVTEDVLQLVKDLKDTLINHTDPEGVGIAAPQIGISKRVFIVRDDENGEITSYINPTITTFSTESYFDINPEEKHIMEGCLSIPGIYGQVTRAHEIEIEYLDETGKQVTAKPSGLLATYVQHEFDHVEGVLFTERALAEGNQLYKVENEKWVPIEIAT